MKVIALALALLLAGCNVIKTKPVSLAAAPASGEVREGLKLHKDLKITIQPVGEDDALVQMPVASYEKLSENVQVMLKRIRELVSVVLFYEAQLGIQHEGVDDEGTAKENGR